MLFAEVSGKPAESSTAATSAGGDVRSKCELIKNSSSESAIQPANTKTMPSSRRFRVKRRRQADSASPRLGRGGSQPRSRRGSRRGAAR